MVLNMRNGRKISKKWWDGFWMQTQIPTRTYNYYFLTHWQCSLKFACKFNPWYLHLFNKLTSKNCGNNNLLCEGSKIFSKYQAQGGGFPPCVRPWVWCTKNREKLWATSSRCFAVYLDRSFCNHAVRTRNQTALSKFAAYWSDDFFSSSYKTWQWLSRLLHQTLSLLAQ